MTQRIWIFPKMTRSLIVAIVLAVALLAMPVTATADTKPHFGSKPNPGFLLNLTWE